MCRLLQFQQSSGTDAADVGLGFVPVALDGVSVFVFLGDCCDGDGIRGEIEVERYRLETSYLGP